MFKILMPITFHIAQSRSTCVCMILSNTLFIREYSDLSSAFHSSIIGFQVIDHYYLGYDTRRQERKRV